MSIFTTFRSKSGPSPRTDPYLGSKMLYLFLSGALLLGVPVLPNEPTTMVTAPAARPSCHDMAAAGDCKTNAGYMLSQCVLACQAVAAGGAAKPAPTAVARPGPTARPTPAATAARPGPGAVAAKPAPAAVAAKPAPTVAPSTAKVLVLVSDHGSGTSEFGQALNTHPCVFDVETPFSFSNTLWSKSKLDLPCDATMPHAIFDADTGQMTMTANHQLDSKLITLSQSKTKHVSLTPAEFNGDASPLYSGLRYNLADYFVRIRDLVCKGVPADVCPPSECTVTLQMFPQFINANTAWQEMKEDEPSACTAARNDKVRTLDSEPTQAPTPARACTRSARRLVSPASTGAAGVEEGPRGDGEPSQGCDGQGRPQRARQAVLRLQPVQPAGHQVRLHFRP
jgi:hypothetical protein